jgi:hypothetical protein
MEYQLTEFEITHFKINKKKWYYVNLGGWNAIPHKRLTPGEIWSILSFDGDISIPRIHKSSPSSTLAQAMGSLDIALQFKKSTSITSADSDESSISTDEGEIDDTSPENEVVVEPPLNIPIANQFLLLHSLFLSKSGCNLFDRLLNEITRFSEGTEIKFKRGNNTESTMAIVPEFRTLDKYKKHIKGDSSVLDKIIRAITRHTKCQNDEATKVVLMALYHKWEETFITVAVKQGVSNGIPPRVMDEVSVEAMLHEANVNWTNTRVYFVI